MVRQIELFKLLTVELGEETAENVITFIENEIKEKKDTQLASKEDFYKLQLEIKEIKQVLTIRITAIIGCAIIVLKLLEHFGI